MGKLLTFSTGLVEYEVNGATVIRFNPTDETFTDNLFAFIGSLGEGESETEDPLKKFKDYDAKTRKDLDDLFGEGTADALFPGINCYSLADGMPIVVNFALAVLDEVIDAYEREYGKQDSRMKALNNKYGNIRAKYAKRK